jgi:hypothetical protein
MARVGISRPCMFCCRVGTFAVVADVLRCHAAWSVCVGLSVRFESQGQLEQPRWPRMQSPPWQGHWVWFDWHVPPHPQLTSVACPHDCRFADALKLEDDVAFLALTDADVNEDDSCQPPTSAPSHDHGTSKVLASALDSLLSSFLSSPQGSSAPTTHATGRLPAAATLTTQPPDRRSAGHNSTARRASATWNEHEAAGPWPGVHPDAASSSSADAVLALPLDSRLTYYGHSRPLSRPGSARRPHSASATAALGRATAHPTGQISSGATPPPPPKPRPFSASAASTWRASQAGTSSSDAAAAAAAPPALKPRPFSAHAAPAGCTASQAGAYSINRASTGPRAAKPRPFSEHSASTTHATGRAGTFGSSAAAAAHAHRPRPLSAGAASSAPRHAAAHRGTFSNNSTIPLPPWTLGPSSATTAPPLSHTIATPHIFDWATGQRASPLVKTPGPVPMPATPAAAQSSLHRGPSDTAGSSLCEASLPEVRWPAGPGSALASTQPGSKQHASHGVAGLCSGPTGFALAGQGGALDEGDGVPDWPNTVELRARSVVTIHLRRPPPATMKARPRSASAPGTASASTK